VGATVGLATGFGYPCVLNSITLTQGGTLTTVNGKLDTATRNVIPRHICTLYSSCIVVNLHIGIVHQIPGIRNGGGVGVT